MPEMQLDWSGLINLLAQNLYSEKRVFIRELIQNAHDAIIRRQAFEAGFTGRINIQADASAGVLTVTDNGIGMDDADIRDYLSTIGIGATRVQQGVPGLIGYFGIGFLSAFVVSERVTVITRKIEDDNGWKWINTGSREYVLEPAKVSSSGTTVIVDIRPTERGVLDTEEVLEVIKKYADLLPVPIFVNKGRSPANRMTMPWEKETADFSRFEIECRLYIADSSGEDATEIMPIREPGTSGLLYITKARVLGVAPPRSVRVFVRRMFISSNLPELLPEWAGFINGVINSDVLSPTASRPASCITRPIRSAGSAMGPAFGMHAGAAGRSHRR